MLEPFGEVGRDVSEYFSSIKDFRKMTWYKIIAKNQVKKLQLEFSRSPLDMFNPNMITVENYKYFLEHRYVLP